jgi:putative nucleotidyltransferase with HDIG domain
MTQMASVLIVDDEPAVRNLMARWVASLGMRPDTAANAEEALATLRSTHYDLAVIDVMMPGHNGLWLASQVQRDHPHTALVIATGYTELLDEESQKTPIADLLVKPFQRDRFKLAVDRGRQWRKQALEEVEWHARLSFELQDRVEQICASLRRNAVDESREADTLLALALDRLPETVEHSERVARYASSAGREMGLEPHARAAMEVAARFHDIGKAAMPDALLLKPSPLTPGEMAIMRRHVHVGAEILSATTTLKGAAPIVMTSHEWFGGGGYPLKLAGVGIPLASRIISVVDAYDAMTQDRAYRVRLDSSDAIAELLRCTPSQFDPTVVSAFLAILGRH